MGGFIAPPSIKFPLTCNLPLGPDDILVEEAQKGPAVSGGGSCDVVHKHDVRGHSSSDIQCLLGVALEEAEAEVLPDHILLVSAVGGVCHLGLRHPPTLIICGLLR